MIWTWRRWCNVLLMVGMLLTAGHAVAGGVDWDTLFAGEVVVEKVQHADGFPGLRASFTVAASRERIWSVYVDIGGGIPTALVRLEATRKIRAMGERLRH